MILKQSLDGKWNHPFDLNIYQFKLVQVCTKVFLKYQDQHVQWGSEIQPSLDFEWSKIGWVANGLDFEWDLKSRSPTI